jgi:xanthine phosphoribosyltransferase
MSNMYRWPRSWQQIAEDTQPLIAWARTMQPKLIIAVARGGLVPASIIAYALGIKKIDMVAINGYDGDKFNPELEMLKFPGAVCYDLGAEAIVVDDIASTGRTMEKVKALLPNSLRCVIYATPQIIASSIVHMVAKPITHNTWVEFPWGE